MVQNLQPHTNGHEIKDINLTTDMDLFHSLRSFTQQQQINREATHKNRCDDHQLCAHN